MLLHICKKKHKNNRKRASANCPTTLFFKQNKQHVKQAGKKGKTLRQDTTNASKRKINKLISGTKKKGIGNERNLLKTRKRNEQEPAKRKKGTNMSYFLQKSKHAVRKNVVKNKASKQLHI